MGKAKKIKAWADFSITIKGHLNFILIKSLFIGLIQIITKIDLVFPSIIPYSNSATNYVLFLILF